MINISIAPTNKNLTQHIMKHTQGDYWYVSKFLQLILDLAPEPRILKYNQNQNYGKRQAETTKRS